MQMTKAQLRSWVAGFTDGEGCIWFRKIKRADGEWRSARVISISNTEYRLIKFLCFAFRTLGITYGIRKTCRKDPKHKPFWTVEVRRAADMERFREQIPIQSKPKASKLAAALSFARGLRCHSCKALHDEWTKGCGGCKSRHYFRRMARRRLAGKLKTKPNLPMADVREIRRLLANGQPVKRLAARFRISRGHLWRIRTGKRWGTLSAELPEGDGGLVPSQP